MSLEEKQDYYDRVVAMARGEFVEEDLCTDMHVYLTEKPTVQLPTKMDAIIEMAYTETEDVDDVLIAAVDTLENEFSWLDGDLFDKYLDGLMQAAAYKGCERTLQQTLSSKWKRVQDRGRKRKTSHTTHTEEMASVLSAAISGEQASSLDILRQHLHHHRPQMD